MPFNGSGTFSRTNGDNTGSTTWQQDRDEAVKITASRHDAHDQDLADGLTQTITKDGQTTITENIPFNGKKITGLGDATAATDALNRQAGDARYLTPFTAYQSDTGGALTSSGTDTVTLTTGGTLTSYADGTRLHFVAGGTNTGAATLNVNSIGAKALRKVTAAGEEALQAGDITAAMHCIVQYDASAASGSGAWVLINPGRGIGTLRNITTILTSSSGTYTTPTWATALFVIVQGAGGGGGFAKISGGTIAVGGGGGGGGTSFKFILGPASSYAYVVGAGGAGGTITTPTAATNGGGSSFGSMTGGGGLAGSGGTDSAYPGYTSGGSGATGTNGDYHAVGETGDHGFTTASNGGVGGRGGRSWFGGASLMTVATNAGTQSTSVGGGGGGAAGTSGRNGAGGNDGGIIVYEYG